ncbi:DNA-processing protein DprA [Amycolatopsis sp. cg9]|uniref:DNA-processing protein DprA n=1 Tax=Amycolatopsis sp. cg9 TaxID=3238801 RepID=UPI0035237B5D
MSRSIDARRARAFLQHAAEPTSAALARYVARVGAIDAAHRIAERTAPSGVLADCRDDAGWELTDASLDAAAQAGGRFVIPGDDEWPTDVLTGLTHDDDAPGVPPMGLWVRGAARLNELAGARSVAIVGSRAATQYGEHHAAELAHALASRGVTVWSGAAYGVDGAAHRGALATDRPGSTVAILGCGFSMGYPAGHVGLLERIARVGAVVSEYPPHTPPARHRFLARHRLLAALTRATVIVETGVRGGARTTAGTAAALSRPVMALPGPVTSVQSAGCHQLIQTGTARLVTSADDIIAAIDKANAAETEPEADVPAGETPGR